MTKTESMSVPSETKNLPLGWRSVRLGEVCERIDYGYTTSADVDITSPKFLRITDIQDGRVDWNKVPGCAISSDDEDSKSLREGDVVFARTGATTGKSYLVTNPPRSVFASYLIRVRTRREHTDPSFLFSFFQSGDYWAQISAGARGGAQAGFNATMLAALIIPLPPIDEQRRIAAVLRDQMSAVDKARAAAQARLEAVKTLPAAYLRQIFPRPGQALPAGWRWVKLGDVCSRISKGESPAWQGFEYHATGVLFVRSENVRWGDFCKEPSVYIPEEFHAKLSRSSIEEGDVLINLVGASIGRACVVPTGIRNANVNQAVAAVSCGKCLSSEYLVFFVISPQTQRHFEKVQVEMARPNISLENLRDLLIPLPPLSEQRQIAGLLREQMSAVEKARSEAERELQTVNALPAALLRQAFNGEI